MELNIVSGGADPTSCIKWNFMKYCMFIDFVIDTSLVQEFSNEYVDLLEELTGILPRHMGWIIKLIIDMY